MATTGGGSGDEGDDPALAAQAYGDAAVPSPVTAAPLRTQMNVPLWPAVSLQLPLKQLPPCTAGPVSVEV